MPILEPVLLFATTSVMVELPVALMPPPLFNETWQWEISRPVPEIPAAELFLMIHPVMTAVSCAAIPGPDKLPWQTQSTIRSL